MKLMHFYKLQKKNGRLMGQSHELDSFEDLWNNEIYTSYTFFLIFEMFLFQATYSTLLEIMYLLIPYWSLMGFFMYFFQHCFIKFHSVRGNWDRTQDCCDFGIGVSRSNHTARSHPPHKAPFCHWPISSVSSSQWMKTKSSKLVCRRRLLLEKFGH